MTCRHRTSWLVASGWIEWCYRCGAIRVMRVIAGTNRVEPAGRWQRPSGPNGENPALGNRKVYSFAEKP